MRTVRASLAKECFVNRKPVEVMLLALVITISILQSCFCDAFTTPQSNAATTHVGRKGRFIQLVRSSRMASMNLFINQPTEHGPHACYIRPSSCDYFLTKRNYFFQVRGHMTLLANKRNNENKYDEDYDNDSVVRRTNNDDEQKENPLVSLFSKNDDNDTNNQQKGLQRSGDNKEEQQPIDTFSIEEPRLLLGDLIALLITCQLLGLMDILDTSEFWINGGFAQPVDLSPEGVSTLGTLIKRDSAMSIAWVLSSIKHRGYTIGTVADDITAVKCSFTILVDYCSLLIVFALLSAFATNSSVDAILILRQSYYTILVLCAFRVVFGRLYNTL